MKRIPTDIQPYYRAWMYANPEQPRVWEKDRWENHMHFINWIHKMHRRYRSEALKINNDGYAAKESSYTEDEIAYFEIWLFESLGILAL